MLPVDYEGYKDGAGIKFYEGARGDAYYLYRQAAFYHNWYSSRMYGEAEVDGYTREAFDANARRIFENPRIKEIMGWGRPLQTPPLS
jgi:hypothetical protein